MHIYGKASHWLQGFMQQYGTLEDHFFNIDGVEFKLKPHGIDKIKVFCHYGMVNEAQSAKAYKMLLHMNFLLSSDCEGNRPIFSIDEDNHIMMEDILSIQNMNPQELYEFLYQLAAHAKKWQYNFGMYQASHYFIHQVQ